MNKIATDLILGMQFLEQNDVIIDLSEKTITIYSKQFELNSNGENVDVFEKELINKTKALVIAGYQKDVQMNLIIKKNKALSNNAGPIKNVFHRIDTKMKIFKDVSRTVSNKNTKSRPRKAIN